MISIEQIASLNLGKAVQRELSRFGKRTILKRQGFVIVPDERAYEAISAISAHGGTHTIVRISVLYSV
jgi:hypothetical protein